MFNTTQVTDLKWGTKNPIMVRDPEFGPVRLRAFGTYCVRVSDPGRFIKQIAGTDSLFQTDEIIGQFRNILASRFADALAEARIPMIDLAANYNEMGDLLRNTIKVEFDEYAIAHIEVTENDETPLISDYAIEKIPAAILNSQSTQVDAVTGATKSSEGIKRAVEDAIRKALRK